MKKKFLTLLPLFFFLFIGVASVNAQASYVSDSEAITLLETQISDLSNDLAQATPGTDAYAEISTNLSLRQGVLKHLNSGTTVENAVEGVLTDASSRLSASNNYDRRFMKPAYLDLVSTLSN